MLRHFLGLCAISFFTTSCGKDVYNQLPRSTTIVPPWYSNIEQLPNSFGFQNLGTGVSPSVLYLSDNNANDGDILSIALNGQVINQDIRITTPDAGPPHSVTMPLIQGENRVDILCVSDPGGGCTLQAEISNTTAGTGLTTINRDPIPQGEYASFIVEYKPL